MHRQKFLNYNEAKDYLKNLDIKTQRAYKKWQKENRIKFVESFCRKFGVIVKLVKEIVKVMK